MHVGLSESVSAAPWHCAGSTFCISVWLAQLMCLCDCAGSSPADHSGAGFLVPEGAAALQRSLFWAPAPVPLRRHTPAAAMQACCVLSNSQVCISIVSCCRAFRCLLVRLCLLQTCRQSLPLAAWPPCTPTMHAQGWQCHHGWVATIYETVSVNHTCVQAVLHRACPAYPGPFTSDRPKGGPRRVGRQRCCFCVFLCT